MGTLNSNPEVLLDGALIKGHLLSTGGESARHKGAWARKLKRWLDIVTSVTMMLLLMPLCALIVLAIKLTSRGPVLFRQERIGLGGKRFTILKFRTMTADNDPSIHRDWMRDFITKPSVARRQSWKMSRDPRVTPLGHALRRTCLDEIPQFFNVLKGEMSLVGPRPCIPYEYEYYQAWHCDRVTAMPGLTGLWQISDRARISFDEMVKLDLEYIRHWSIWLDIRILLRTPSAVLFAKGNR